MQQRRLQTEKELDAFYVKPDPWNYENSTDDAIRKSRLLALLPDRSYTRTLDIGCGDGFITFSLPGEEIIGCDLSRESIKYALLKKEQSGRQNISFIHRSLFDLKQSEIGTFDLISITGVLYPQYIGKSSSFIFTIIDDILNINGILVSCHIDEWQSFRFPYTTVDISLYPYREYTHKLEVYIK